MPRKKTSALPEAQVLAEENEKLRKEIAKLKPRRVPPGDGAVTFKSPWPKFQVVLKQGGYLSTGLRSSILINPIVARFDNQVCTFGPEDTFEEDGKVIRKIDRMREIYQRYVKRRRRPQFLEVTEDSDLRIQSFRERVPPANLVEFKGPLVDLPEIPPPPPKEAQETIDTLEGRRRAY